MLNVATKALESAQAPAIELLSPYLNKADNLLNSVTSSLVDNSWTSQAISYLSGGDEEESSGRKSTLKTLIRFSIIAPSTFTAVGYFLCRYRLLPYRRLYQVWWACTAVPAFLAAGAFAFPAAIARKLGLISQQTLFYYASDVTQLLCKYLHWINPQLRKHVHHADENNNKVSFHDVKKGSIYTVNHNSFEDAFLIYDVPHLHFFHHVKMMGKAGVQDTPIVGFLVFECLQYFKVHFMAKGGEKSEADYNNWKVDAEKQEKEMERVVEWINQGNTFAYAPEGRCSKDPKTIQSPRHGMFKIFLDAGMKKQRASAGTDKPLTLKEAMPDIFLLSNYATCVFWPYGAFCPGFPADIHISLSKFEYPDNLEEKWVKIDSETHTPTYDAGAFSKAIHEFMQKELDKLVVKSEEFAKSEKNKFLPFFFS